MQDLIQEQIPVLIKEQIPVPIQEWSRGSIKDQIQINTTKKNVRMHILFCCTNPADSIHALHERRFAREIKCIRVSQNNASGYRHNFQLQVQKCQGSYDSH